MIMPSTRPKQAFPLVECIWTDACDHDDGWEDKVKVKPHLVLSVGFLLSKSNGHLVMAMDLDEGSMHNGRAQIPLGMVRTIKVLRKADK